MDRRSFLGATAAATLANVVADKASATAMEPSKHGAVTIDTQHVLSDLGKKIPVNRARASAVMEELGLDGLIALRPHNVYYLTNTITTLTDFTDEYPAFATLPRDLKESSFLISSTGNTWETANGEREVPEIIAFSGPRNWHDYVNATPEQMRIEPESAAKNYRFAVRPDTVLSPREAGWKHAQDTYFPASAGSREWALVHALKQSGLAKGKIAVDDMRVAYLLQSIGFDGVTIVPGDNVFRKIRHIKSDYEVAMMRVAQQITREAVLAAARTLEEGMTFEEFRLRFFTEATARGGDPGFVLLGMTQGLLPDGVVKRGQSYLMDCSVHFHKYQGDFARTVTVGEPSAEILKRVKAQQAGREAAFDIIKEGVPFRLVEQTAKDAMIKAGMPSGLPVIGIHSVGLQHGDDPMRMDVPFGVRDDHILAENMTVTLDLPYIEIGGGAGHNEDLLRITKTGYELLNDPGEPLVVV